MKRGKIMRRLTMLAIGCSLGALQAGTISQTLGSTAGFADGSTNARVGTWNTATSGHPAPFNGFIGSDTGASDSTDFSTNWSFSYGSLAGDTITDATLTLGIYDIDSVSAGNQVASYMEGLIDLTALLNAVSEARNGNTGAVNNEYDILTISLPASTFTDLSGGAPTIALSLKSPGAGAGNVATASNGAGIDFSTITINFQPPPPPAPEPGTWVLLLAGLGGIAARRWRRRA